MEQRQRKLSPSLEQNPAAVINNLRALPKQSFQAAPLILAINRGCVPMIAAPLCPNIRRLAFILFRFVAALADVRRFVYFFASSSFFE
jgi:hypothetical protein